MLLSRSKAFILALALIAFFSTVHRAQAASLSFNPSSSGMKQQCSEKIDIILDTQGVSSNAADAVILFNPAEVDIEDQNGSVPGTQIKPGTIYQIYAGNLVNESQSKILLTAFSVMGDFNGSGLLGSIFFKTKPGVSSTTFQFDFTPGSSIDSNIADGTGNDVLSSVNVGSYTFTASPCVTDSQPPTVTHVNPLNGATGVALGGNVSFHLEDNQSGVDLSSVMIQLYNASYQHDSPQVTVTGLPLDYALTIDPDSDFPAATEIVLVVQAKDLVGNTMPSRVFSFNKPPAPPGPPPAALSPICGNSVVETGEACEPPGTFGCSATCQADVLQCLEVDPQVLETLANGAVTNGTLTSDQVGAISDLKTLQDRISAQAASQSLLGGVSSSKVVNYVTKSTESLARSLGCGDTCVKTLFGDEQQHWYIPVGMLVLFLMLVGSLIVLVVHRIARS